MKKSVFCLAALAALMILFTGCANSSGGDSDSSSGKGKGGNGGGTTPINSAEKKIGSAGGEVVTDNVKISIPQGALDEDTNISVKYIAKQEEINDIPCGGFLGAVEFGPSGTEFNKEAEVTISLVKIPSSSSLSVFCYDEVNNIWDFTSPATYSDGLAKFKISHFSKYRVIDVTEEMLNTYINLVYSAQTDNKADSWITSQYCDYLLNTIKVMETYAIQDGSLHKACGFLIDCEYYYHGKEGDPNDLIYLHGKTNDIGNKCGVCKLGSKLISYNTYSEKKGEVNENQEIVYTSVTIYYDPVPTYYLEGHITEEEEYSIEVFPDPSIHEGIVTKQNGKIKVSVDYDFQGLITQDEGDVNGIIDYKNIKTKVDTTETKYDCVAEGSVYGKGNFKINIGNTNTNSSFSSDIKGTCSENGICNLNFAGGAGEIANVSGEEVFQAQWVWVIQGEIEEEKWKFTASIKTGGNKTPIYNFDILDTSLQKTTKTEFKDSFNFIDEESYLSIIDSDFNNNAGIECLSHNKKTTQTITVTAVPFEP